MSRTPEPRLVDPATHPRRSVGLKVGADFLGMGERTLRRRIEEGLIPAYRDGKLYRIKVRELVRYKAAPPDVDR